MSYTKNYQHIIFRTKRSLPTIPLECSDELYRYIWGFCKRRNVNLFRINGMQEHLHLFADIPTTIAIADFVRELKASTSRWLKDNPRFPDFQGWAEGYASFSYGENEFNKIVNYIRNQREHHATVSFADEMRKDVLPLLSPQEREFFIQSWID